MIISKKVYGLMGPTAIGKTKFSIKLAKRMKAEIISVDSSSIYKVLNIGSAKPKCSDMDGVRHHLIDIVEPWVNNYSVNEFLIDAKEAIKCIHNRKKEVLLVGGTMMYFKLLQEGISRLPQANHRIRKILESKKLSYWYEFLVKEDMETAKKIHPHDRYRITRAIEVMMITKEPYSQVVSKNLKKGGLGNNLKLCAIIPNSRKNLHKKIETRFVNMIKNGLLEEVVALRKLSNMHINLPSIRSVGYYQAWEYLNGDYKYDEFILKGVAATRQLAKKQITWIRNWNSNIFILKTDQLSKEDMDQLLEFFY